MPRTGGSYSLPPSYKATSGQTIRTEQHNPPLEDIAQALTGSLPRDGSAPMTANLPMNGQKVTNLGAGTAASDAVRRDQVTLYSAYLSSVAGLAMEANTIPYATGAGVAAKTAFSAVARTFLAKTTEAEQQASLGLTRLDEDNMASNRADAVASQQSIKAYVDAKSQILHVRDEKSSGTNGGTATAGLFQRRDLNTVETNTIPGASLSASQFTLPAGTYDIQASAPAFEAGGHQARLYNATDGTYPIIGGNEVNGSDRIGSSRSLIMGRITITATKAFEIRHRVSATQSNNGFGVSLGFGTEVYTDVVIRRVS